MARNWSDRDVENLLRQAVGQSVPDIYRQVSTEPVDPLLNPDHIVPPQRPRRRRFGRALGALCALLCLVLGIGLFFQFHTAAIVSIGEEPDVELSVNRFGRVLEARGCSEAGEALLAGLSLKGEDLDDAVEHLGWTMAESGYLDGSDVPVSVDGGDWKYNRELQEEAQEALEDVLEDWGGGGHAVAGPVTGVTGDGTASAPAVTASGTPTPTGQTGTAVPPVVSTPVPTAAGSSLWTEEQARQAALAHAGVSSADATFTKTELDQDNGRTVYELEFYTGGTEYEYEVDAFTGAVLKSEQQGGHGGAGSSTISAAQAENIALQHAGLTAGQVTERKVELDEDDGALYYKVEFKQGGMEYEYEIDAVSGAIRAVETD